MFNLIARDIASHGEDETTIILIHRHWFDILKNFAFIFLLIFAVIASHNILPVLFPTLAMAGYDGLLLFFESGFSMLIVILSFLIWIDYYFDVWIVTNKRIINIEQKRLFSREVSELELDKIQDVSANVLGIIPTFLNYGDVLIQTAGEREKFVFKKIADPYGIKDLIMSLEKTNENRIEKERSIIEARELKSALQDPEYR